MHRSLQIYIERTYWKTQSVVLGGNPCHHRFFVRLVGLIFRLTVGTFACFAAVGPEEPIITFTQDLIKTTNVITFSQNVISNPAVNCNHREMQ